MIHATVVDRMSAAGHIDQDQGNHESHEVVTEECFLKDEAQAQADGDQREENHGFEASLAETSPDPAREEEGKRNRHRSGNHQQASPGEMELPHDGSVDRHGSRTILYSGLELVEESALDLF